MSDNCFVDSNIWLYAFMDSSSAKRNQALQLIGGEGIILSTQVINEVCANLLRKAGYTEPEIQQTIDNFQARYPILNVTERRTGYVIPSETFVRDWCGDLRKKRLGRGL